MKLQYNLFYTFFRLMNSLFFQKYFFIYKPLYFLYKEISDRRKILVLKSAVKPGMTILDIGANIGFYTKLFSKLVGKHGKVYAFEPDDLNFKYLQVTTETLDNVILEKSAVGEKSEKIRLYISDHLNVDHHTYDDGENRTSKEIQCVSIDDFLKNKGCIDFIKIDIQGYDYYAILGMKDTIKRSDKVMILGEFWPYGLNKAGSKVEDYINILKKMGFTINFLDNKKDLSSKVNEHNYHTDFFAQKEASKIISS